MVMAPQTEGECHFSSNWGKKKTAKENMIEEIVIKMAQLRPVKISLIVKWTNRSSFDD